ncbi:MAG: hypothetical protein AB1629_00350 [Candidatus Omnitrophota bacterium]
MSLIKVSMITFGVCLLTLVLFSLAFFGYKSTFANVASDHFDAALVHFSDKGDASEGAWVDEEWRATQFFVTHRIPKGAGAFDDELRYEKLNDPDLNKVITEAAWSDGIAIDIDDMTLLEFETSDNSGGPAHTHNYNVPGIHVDADVVPTGWAVSGHVHFQNL